MDAQTRKTLIAKYKDGYRVVAEALVGAKEAELDTRPAPGKWTAREVVHHLADSEMTSAIRLHLLLAVDKPVINGYDQEEFARRPPVLLRLVLALAFAGLVLGSFHFAIGRDTGVAGLLAMLSLKPMEEWGAIAEQDLELLQRADSPAEAFEQLRDHLITHHLEPPTTQEAAAPGIAKTRG